MISKVSFSLRNDDEERILLYITNPHSPREVLNYMSSGNREVNNNIVKTIESSSKKSSSFVSVLDQDDDVYYYETEENETSQSSCIFDSLLENSSSNETQEIHESDTVCNRVFDEDSRLDKQQDDHNYEFCCSLTNQNNNGKADQENFINLSQMSVWSDWCYQPKKQDCNFIFHPSSFDHSYTKCETVVTKEIYTNCSMDNVRFWLEKIKFRSECQISKNTIKSLKVSNSIKFVLLDNFFFFRFK